MAILSIFIVLILSAIFWQDIRTFRIYWFFFPLLTLSWWLRDLIVLHERWVDIVQQSAIILGFLLLQWIMVSGYFSLRKGKWINLTLGFFGWGDVLFLVSISFGLSFVNFLVFYILSLIVILVGVAFMKRFYGFSWQWIPLAGLQSFLLAFLILFWTFFPKGEFYWDGLLQQYFSR